MFMLIVALLFTSTPVQVFSWHDENTGWYREYSATGVNFLTIEETLDGETVTRIDDIRNNLVVTRGYVDSGTFTVTPTKGCWNVEIRGQFGRSIQTFTNCEHRVNLPLLQ